MPPARYQGRFGFPPDDDLGVRAVPPTEAPHRVQKRAPGTRFAAHSGQVPLVREVPQDGQKLPSDSVPQFGHFMTGE